MLVVVGATITMVYAFELDTRHGLAVLGKVGTGFVMPSVPRIGSIAVDVAEQFRTVLVLGMLGFIESIVASKLYASKHNYDVSPVRSQSIFVCC